MKNAIIVFLMLILIKDISAQNYPAPAITDSKPDDAMHGIKSTMYYEAILKSNLTQKQLMAKIKGFLAEIKMLDTSKVKLNAIDNKKATFTIPLSFRQGFWCGKGKTIIAKRLKSPVMLYYDAVFTFVNGEIKIGFTNFVENPFFELDPTDKFGYKYEVGNPATTKIEKLKDDVMNAGTVFGKVMTVYDAGGASGQIKIGAKGVSVETDKAIRDQFASLNHSLDEEYKIIDDAINNKIGSWLIERSLYFSKSKEELIIKMKEDMLMRFNDVLPKSKKSKDIAAQQLQEGYLLIIDNERWNKHFETSFNNVFLGISNLIEGEITGIAKDGEIKYTITDGKLIAVKK